ncbi:MAG TPA: hypothetical protein VJA26_02645 [Gammaproteobacteria bacterium]|nr:hypothetical protein [Gammaproteobacteria bacterium]
MAALLNLKRARVCKLGGHINVRSEKHGEDNVPACDVSITGVLLDRDEVDALLGEGSHEALYVTNGKNTPPEPRFREFKPFALLHKFEKSRVALEIDGIKDEVVFDDIKLARLRIEPKTGGLTALGFSVQCTPSSDIMAQLYDHLDREVKAKVRFGKLVERDDGKQKELGLNGGGNGTGSGDETDGETSED